MTTVPDYIRMSRHQRDLDDDGHDIFGVSAVVGFAELNSNATTSGTPNTPTTIDFDTFYDVDGVAGSLPAGLSLTYSGGSFTATEDGIWVFNMGILAVAAPGSAGYLQLSQPDYGFSPKIYIEASGNHDVLDKERTVRMRSADSFQVNQQNAGSSVDQIDGYAVLEIIRIARSVS